MVISNWSSACGFFTLAKVCSLLKPVSFPSMFSQHRVRRTVYAFLGDIVKYDVRRNVKLPVCPHKYFLNQHTFLLLFCFFYTKQTSDCPHPPSIEIPGITAYFKPQRHSWRKTGHSRAPSFFQSVDVPSRTSQRNPFTPGLPRGKEAGNASVSAY